MGEVSFENLRVFIDANVHEIYLELTRGTNDQAEDVPFTMMPDLFVAAACVGSKLDKYKELGTQKRDIFVADAFKSKTHIPILMALAFKKTKDLNDLYNPKLVLNICEGWANGGILILREQIFSSQGLRPLYRFIDLIQKEKQSS